jgi:hypothetical protein
MTDYFEDTRKYTTKDLNIGGIECVSRYGRKYEADQMTAFVVMLGSKIPLRISQIKMVFYDSQAQMATIEFHGGKDSFNDHPWMFLPEHVERAIFEAARQTINQFAWGGAVEHGFRYARRRGGEND